MLDGAEDLPRLVREQHHRHPAGAPASARVQVGAVPGHPGAGRGAVVDAGEHQLVAAAASAPRCVLRSTVQPSDAM